ncbi:MAG: thermonuclease family protein [Elusimicrobiaceae bacterium]|nr:thermonuclease family protein [Elusimicrobiaceae bacterium]
MANFDNVSLISVYDGDTFYVDIPSCDIDVFCKHISVRLRGVDCPEMKGGTAETKARAKQAKEFSERFLKNGKILLYNCGRDKYFRLLCDVNVNKRNLAQELIKNGYGIPYDGGTKTL